MVIAAPALAAVSDSGTYSVIVPDNTQSASATTSGGAIVSYVGDSASNQSSGTGIFDPFVRLQGSPTEQGYNTDGTLQFDTKSGTWTHSILVSEIPVVTVNGKNYWELANDINETNSTAYISLNKVEVYFTSNKNLTGYSSGFASNATLAYTFDGSILIHDVNSGSGRADLVYLVPTDSISVPASCGYLDPSCSTYFVLYSEWGTTGDYSDGHNYNSDGGFEEWKTRQHATLQIVKNTVGGNGTFGFSVTGTPTPPVANPTITTSGGTGATQNWVVAPGTYKISETSTPSADWVFQGATCSVNGAAAAPYTPGSDIVIANDSTHVLCTFTNKLNHPAIGITKGVSTVNGSGYGPSLTTTAGTTVYYRIVVSNTGDIPLTGVTLTDNLFDLGAKGCTIPTTLAVGGSFTCDYSDTAAVGTKTNTATADSNETPSVDDSASVTVEAAPGLAITKGVSLTNGSGYGPSLTTTAGTTVYYRIVVSNTGNIPLTGVTLTDNLFDLGAKGCTIPTTLAVGGSFTCDYSDTAAVGTKTNTATADSNETPSVDDSASVTGQTPILNLVKEVSVNGSAFAHTGSANPGDTLTYRLTITNTGDAAATGETVTDNLSSVLAHATWQGFGAASSGSPSFTTPNVTWSGISIAANGGTATLTFSVILDSVFPEGTSHLPNIAVEANSENCPSATSENPDCSTDTTVTAAPILNLVKEVSVNGGAFAHTGAADPGDTLTYRITITNSGNANASGESVTDDLSSVLAHATWDDNFSQSSGSVDFTSPNLTWSGISIAASGGTATLTFSVTLDPSGWAAGTTDLPNIAVEANSQNCPSAASENPDCATDTTVTTGTDLGITKAVDPSSIPGGSSTATAYTIVVSNSGNGDTNGHVLVTDNDFPAFYSITGVICAPTNATCDAAHLTGGGIDLGVLAAGASVTITVNGTASPNNTSDLGDHVNNAYACEQVVEGQPVCVHAPATLTVTLTHQPGIDVVKTPSTDFLPYPGGEVTYTYAVTNTGNVPLSNVTLTDDKCADVTFVGGDSNSNQLLDLTETWTFQCTSSISSTTTNVATAAGHDGETVVQASDEATVDVGAQLLITKAITAGVTDGAPIVEGDKVTYTLSYTLANGPVTDGVITDVLPDGLTYVAGTATDNDEFAFQSYDGATRTLTWKAGTVSKDGSVSYKVEAAAGSADLDQPLVNTATIDSDQTEPDSDTASVSVGKVEDLTPPPTSTLDQAPEATAGNGLLLLLVAIAGFMLVAGVLAPTPARARRRNRRG